MNADGIARIYRTLEYCSFGRALERTRETYLADVRDARRVLALGDGDGRALAALLKCAPLACADTYDLSPKMLAMARHWAGDAGLEGRIAFHHGDILTASFPAQEYDVITAHFVLDCLDGAGVERLAGRMANALAPQGKLLVSEFRTARAWHRAIVRALYLGFWLTTRLNVRRIPNYQAILESHGFRCQQIRLRWGGLMGAELWTR